MYIKFGNESNSYNTFVGHADSFKDAFVKMQEYVKSIPELCWNHRCISINFDQKTDFFVVDFGSYSYFFKCENISETNWKEFFQGSEPKKLKPHELIGIPIQETEYGRKAR